MEGQLGGGGARLDQGDAHVTSGDLLAERLAEGADPELRGVVDPAVESGHPAGHRAHVDHVGHAARLGVGRRQEVRQRRVRAVEEAEQVQVHHATPFLGGGPVDRSEQHDAGVVDQRVEPAEPSDRVRHHLGHLGLVGHIDLQHHHPVGPAPDAVCQLLEAVPAASRDDHRRTVLGQRHRGRRTDPARCAGDQGHGSFEHSGHAGPLLLDVGLPAFYREPWQLDQRRRRSHRTGRARIARLGRNRRARAAGPEEEHAMPEFTSYDAGTPSWVDHSSRDLDASNAFYRALFGWEPEDQGEEMGHYTILRKGGKTVAGNMSAMGEGQPSAWVTYVSVEDADATVDRATKAGATVLVGPMDVADIGRMAVLADPEGAAIGVWQPRTFTGAELANEAGAFGWNELNTRDVAAAKAFYTEVFGWEPHDLDMEGMSTPSGSSVTRRWRG